MDVVNRNNMDSEILDILRPPVRREHKLKQDYIIISKSDGKLFRELSKLYKLEDQKNSKHSQLSSLSLILEKTCKKQIIEKYSLVNSEISHVQKKHIDGHIPNFHNKPTIKVTVIPKKDKNSIIKYLDSQNQTNKINKKESANANGDFFATKNVYVVVAGRKEEKIYEIKTTASSKNFWNKARDVKKLKLNDTKRIALNNIMEKKRKKLLDKIEHEKDKNIDDTCRCNCRRDLFSRETGVGSSKVKIFGRIGLNQNDKYVMKCAATVNGQPVATDFFKEKKIPCCSNGALNVNKSVKTLNESQATQVNIEIYKTRHPTFDQNIQCNSSDFFYETFNSHKTDNVTVGNVRDNTEVNTLKRSNSPLVIISVYPKHEVNNFTVNKLNENTSPTRTNNNRASRNNVKETAKGNNFKNKSVNRNTRERSPYKINETHRPREVNRTEDLKSRNTKGNKASRSSSPSSKSIKIIKESKKVTDSNSVKSSQSPNSVLGKDQKGNRFNKNREMYNASNNTEVKKPRNTNKRSKSKPRDNNVKMQTQNINTIDSDVEKYAKNPNNIKKNYNKANVVINNKKMNDDYVLNKSYPKNDISKVSVNIDSEKEYYDVIFEKRNHNTDLIVRKTMKDIGSQKYFEESFEKDYENDNDFDHYPKSDSLENFFPLDVIGNHRRSISQAFNNRTDDNLEDIQLTAHMSGLNVRDSLEIGHRREEEKDLKHHPSKGHVEYDSYNDDDGDFRAPVKHFPGDNCIIADPIERDRKIRELLGIDIKRTENRFEETQVTFKPDAYRNDNSIRKTFSESLVSCHLLRKCSCSSCFNTRMAIGHERNNLNVTNNAKQNKTRNVNIQLNVTSMSTKQQKTDLYDYNKNPIIVMQSIQSESKSQDIKTVAKNEPNVNANSIHLSKRQYRKVKKSLHIISERRQREKKLRSNSFASVGIGTMKSKRENVIIHFDKDVQTDPPEETSKCEEPKIITEDTKCETKSYHDSTVVLFSRGKKSDKATGKFKNENVKKVASSVEIRFTGFEGTTEVACSHSDVETFGVSKRKKYDSLETIFRGKKRSRTPNLGASALSLLTEDMKQVRESPPPDLKPKKPFLKRLMSCLVMRYAASEVKIAKRKGPTVPTLYSSIDSYHINTSIGAMEMSSSLYDTSASFYSNYTIGPINKAKRGFFCSVREFLSPKKS